MQSTYDPREQPIQTSTQPSVPFTTIPKDDQENVISIAELRPYLRTVHLNFIILEAGPTTVTKDGHLMTTALIADETASVSLCVWDEQGKWLRPGDIFRMKGGFTTMFKNQMILYAGRQGVLERTGSFTKKFVETPNMSQKQWILDQSVPSQTLNSAMFH
eukprot:TRINITY_DN8606_c0_g1_i1.p1 TRINITY_DN8606_c0_g1~~TRINITY_DN8606_c0_g1_i1.p1  ORF type:complete len:160 (+),score=15.15 TRINITY_DN8606_c0_g1_i1:1-480(+)